MPNPIPMNPPKSDSITAALNRNLAAALDLQVRCKHAHWNCTGPNFIAVHKLFDRLAESAAGYADTLAEQARFLGSEAFGTRSAIAGSLLEPYTLGVADTERHLGAILMSLQSLLGATREGIAIALRSGDQPTADIFIEISRGLAHEIYLTRSHLR